MQTTNVDNLLFTNEKARYPTEPTGTWLLDPSDLARYAVQSRRRPLRLLCEISGLLAANFESTVFARPARR